MPAAHVRVLTSLAAGAIAVIQLAGPRALPIAEAIFRPRSGKALSQYLPGRTAYGDYLDADSTVLDDGLAVRGGSAGQPWVEFNLHGGVRIVQRLIRRMTDLGAVLLTGPEAAPADHAFDWLCPLDCWMQQCLAQAATPRAVAWLSGQPGLWRDLLADWRRRLTSGDIESVLTDVQDQLAQGSAGTAWRGRTLAIIGLPNAGKSTIANRLASRVVSLVADQPGTTRDWVGEPIAMGGWPVFLVDTAGLRASDDPVEAEGVARALQQAREADLRLLVVDISCVPSDSEHWLAAQAGLESVDVVARAKCDLPVRRRENGDIQAPAGVRTVCVSSLTGAGWFELEQALLQGFGFPASQEPKPLVFCAQLHESVAHLAFALRERRSAKALAVLDDLISTG